MPIVKSQVKISKLNLSDGVVALEVKMEDCRVTELVLRTRNLQLGIWDATYLHASIATLLSLKAVVQEMLDAVKEVEAEFGKKDEPLSS